MKKSMYRATIIFISVLLYFLTIQPLFAKEDFYGIIESRPEGKVGTWIIDGRSVNVTEKTELDEDNGPLNIGTCAEVDIDNRLVEEIEGEPIKKCKK